MPITTEQPQKIPISSYDKRILDELKTRGIFKTRSAALSHAIKLLAKEYGIEVA